MKSKAELLGKQKDEKDKRFDGYIKLMEESIKKQYPNGLDFNECPHVERFMYHRDVDVTYYTGIEKELIKAIQRTKQFRKISNELIDKGYEYEFNSHVNYSWSKPEWIINLIIS